MSSYRLAGQRIRLPLAALLAVVMLLAAGFPGADPAYGQGSEHGRFVNRVQGALPGGSNAELNEAIYAGLKAVEARLSDYDIEAETRPAGLRDGNPAYLAEVTLRNRNTKQASLYGVELNYSVQEKKWQVAGRARDYRGTPEKALFSTVVPQSGGTKLTYTIGAGKPAPAPSAIYPYTFAACFAPISNQDPMAGTASTRIGRMLQACAVPVSVFNGSAATEPQAWQYLKYGNGLYVWYSNSHGITYNYDGAPCTGLVYAGGNMMYREFASMTAYSGLISCLVYVDACNSYMNPLRDSIIKGHSVDTYIGGTRLMPFVTTDECDIIFWNLLLNQGQTRVSALNQAMSKTGLSGYYAIAGNSGAFNTATIRVELSWSAPAADLDAHLWLPTGQPSPAHIFYGQKGKQDAHPYAWLKADDRDGPGSEVIRVSEAYTGTYSLAVQNWAPGACTLSSSGAKVRVYRGSALLYSFSVPATGIKSTVKQWWHVFDWSPQTGKITAVNRVSDTSPRTLSLLESTAVK